MQPKLAVEDVHRDLEASLLTGEALPELKARRVGRTIDAIIGIDAPRGYRLKAALAAAQWDIPSSRSAAANALRLLSDATSHYEIAGVYRAIGDVDASLHHALSATRLAPTRAAYAEYAADVHIMAGEWHGARRIAADYAQACRLAGAQTDDRFALQVAEIDECIAGFELTGVSWTRLQFELRTALQVLSRHKLRCMHRVVGTDHDPDTNEAAFVHQLGFVGSIEQGLALEEELAHELAAEPGWDPLRLSVELRCMKQLPSDASRWS